MLQTIYTCYGWPFSKKYIYFKGAGYCVHQLKWAWPVILILTHIGKYKEHKGQITPSSFLLLGVSVLICFYKVYTLWEGPGNGWN